MVKIMIDTKKKLLRSMSLIILLVMLTIIVSACTNNLNSGAGPSIELSTTSFDLGDIDPDEGIRSETFYISNKGVSPLEITSISTSCGCTQAEVGSEEILPGEKTKLVVNYDPSVHPNLVGRIKRVVYIQSNDPSNKEVELELVGNSLPSSNPKELVDGDLDDLNNFDGHDEEYEGLLKDFEISPPALYKKIKAEESFILLDVREDFEYQESHIENTLLLSVNKINQEELNKLGLKKDDEIVLYCRSGRRSAKAYEILKALGYTNVKSLYGGIVHWAEDKYPITKGDEISSNKEVDSNEGTASISFDTIEHDFGMIPQFRGIVNTTFQVMNTGDSDLIIESVYTSCGCASAELDELVISSGESTVLTVFFDPDFHEEPKDRFSRTVFMETNDIVTPEAEVKIFVDIIEGK